MFFYLIKYLPQLFYYFRITTEQFKQWSTEITSVFKYEKASTYFVPSNAQFKRVASGKLWDKYNNLKKYIYRHEKVNAEEDVKISPDNQETLLQLRTIQPNDPNITQIWKETFTARNRKSSIANYYEEYPILKTSIGTALVIILYF